MSLMQTFILLYTLATATIIAQASLGNDKIDNLAENILAYSNFFKTNRMIEIFVNCGNDTAIQPDTVNDEKQIAKAFMARGFYTNVNLICKMMINGRIEMRLSSIKYEQHHVWHTMIIVDAGSATHNHALFQMASQLKMFDGHFHWIVIVNSLKQYESIIELLSALDISISSRITLFWMKIDEKMTILYEIWNPSHKHGGRLITSKIGNLTIQNHLHVNDEFRHKSLLKRRSDMQGIRLIVNFVILKKLKEPLEVLLRSRYQPSREYLARSSFSLLDIIKDMFNLTYTLEHSKSWGYSQVDGAFDGMIGTLVRKEADVGGTAMLFRTERHEVLSYIGGSWIHRACFIFQQPDYSATIQNPFLQPFTDIVWIILGIFGLVFTFMLNLFERLNIYDPNLIDHNCSMKQMKVKQHITHKKEQAINHKSQHHVKRRVCKKKRWNVINRNMNVVKMCSRFIISHNNDVKKMEKEMSEEMVWRRSLCLPSKRNEQSRRVCAILNQFFNGLLIFIGAVTLQGVWTKKLNLLSMRMTTFLLMMFGFIISQFYSGSIVSSLLDVKHESIRTIPDLFDSQLKLAMENVPYDIDIFNRTKDPILRRLYHEKIIKHDNRTGNGKSNMFNAEDGVRLIKTGAYAFHVQESTAYEIIYKSFDEKLICRLSEIEAYRPSRLHFSLQKNSTFREVFNFGLLRLREIGMIDRFGKIFYLKRPKCVRNLKPSDFNVNITAIYPLLILLFGGFLISILALIVEICIFHRK